MKITNRQGKEINLYNLYDCYNDFKKLFEFYEKHKNIVDEEELRDRMDYILKNGVKQRTEIETICWVLGEDLVGNKL